MCGFVQKLLLLFFTPYKFHVFYPTEPNESGSLIPTHLLILGVVGGVILCGVTISLCIMCHLRRKERNKPKSSSAHGNGSGAPPVQRNALEMAVNNSNTTSISLYKQSNDGRATMTGQKILLLLCLRAIIL